MAKICARTVLDDTIPGITFDENGVCHFVKIYEKLEHNYPLRGSYSPLLPLLVEKIKRSGRGKRYDCIVGVSGGTDSTYTLWQSVQLGLRPLAVHFDNGWDSTVAVQNIKNACDILKVDLYTYVVDWEEFKDLQRSFLWASVSDVDIPTDVGIHATLIKTAAREGVKYVLNGHSFRTEFLMPITWTYMDGRYIYSVHKKFGRRKLKTFPNYYLVDVWWYNVVKGIQVIPFLNYFDYDKMEIKELMKQSLQWQDYGGHHHESMFTRFVQSYYLPKKFNIDKRKTELSAMILAGKITREEALKILETPYPYEESLVSYVKNKLELSEDEFEEIMRRERKTFLDYDTYYPILSASRPLLYQMMRMGMISDLLYWKYFTARFEQRADGG